MRDNNGNERSKADLALGQYKRDLTQRRTQIFQKAIPRCQLKGQEDADECLCGESLGQQKDQAVAFSPALRLRAP